GRLVPDDYYHQTFQTKKVFGMNTSMYGYNAHADKPRKSSRKCSECGKSGHTKNSCPKKKKSKGKAKKKLIMLRMIVPQNLALLTVLLVMILIATLIYVMV